ncbi:pyridoxamine 5'-phosphate oxidase family protein [Cellulomonas sp. ATA003]|uniref:pyridoxamine 5'-phosphate oxidase family protein n=1 Tax=Cellulomonas sp. ATA003 TaxID=3073064 RepID=UPI0028730ABE|nr:pyridoxamine 5'-phosphate oxidase family protein [Cellulomonas sp. ATA003]WNB87095.1 pyridoxamine 5'-phosphate oxidase family protein [Cellulomonas sp. ATA003]
MTEPDAAVVPLSDDGAWEFLRTQELGRLAFHLLGEVHIVPINYTVSGRRILVRTAPGSKLLGVVMDQDVAFEVDEVDQEAATSVVVRGAASSSATRRPTRRAASCGRRGCPRTRTRSWPSTPPRSRVGPSCSTVASGAARSSDEHARPGRRPTRHGPSP